MNGDCYRFRPDCNCCAGSYDYSCSKPDRTEGDGVGLRQYVTILDDLSAKFAAANPDIKVSVSVVSWGTIDGKVKTLVATGQTPEIVNKNDCSAAAPAGLLYKAGSVK